MRGWMLMLAAAALPAAAQAPEGWQTTDLVFASWRKLDLSAHTQARTAPGYRGVQYFRTGPVGMWRPDERNTWTAGYWWHDSETDFGGWGWSRRACGGWERRWAERAGWELRTRHWGERFWLEEGRVVNRHRHRIQAALPGKLRPAVSAEWVWVGRSTLSIFRPMITVPIYDGRHMQATAAYFYDFRPAADGGRRQVFSTALRFRLRPAR